jgi:hypothetical protein
VSWWTDVDNAVEDLVTINPATLFIHRTDIALALGITPNEASHYLQRHRIAQRRGLTRYVLDAQGYARAAMWLVVSGPGLLRSDLRRGLVMGHTEYVAVDAARRLIGDITAEISPALLSHPSLQTYLTHATAGLETHIRGMVASIHAAVDLMESITGENADRSRVSAV